MCITLGVQSWVCLVKRSISAGHFTGEFLRAALMWFAIFEKLAVDDVEKYVEAPANNNRIKYSCITESSTSVPVKSIRPSVHQSISPSVHQLTKLAV